MLRWGLLGVWPGPWGVVVINVVGSALLAALAHPAVDASESTRVLLGVGLLGGFTTYSTFNLDVLNAIQQGRIGSALLLTTATVGGCLVGGAFGVIVAGWARSG